MYRAGHHFPIGHGRTIIQLIRMIEVENRAAGPLTSLNDEERMFQSTIRKFAREQIQPYVREMDEAGLFRKDLIRQLFEIGLMGIEIPEEYSGQGGTFFQSILAI